MTTPRNQANVDEQFLAGYAAMGYLNGMAEQQPDITYTVVGSEVWMNIEAVGGGDITYYFGNGEAFTLDCTTGDGDGGKAGIPIALGTDTEDVFSMTYVFYSEQDSKLVLGNSTVVPEGAFAYIGNTACGSLANYNLIGLTVDQRQTEAVSHGGRGAMARTRENIRMGGGWENGADMALDVDINSMDITAGGYYQLNHQSFPAWNLLADKMVRKDLTTIDSFADITTTDNGATISTGQHVMLSVYANVNQTEAGYKVFGMVSDVFANSIELMNIVQNSGASMIQHQHRTVGMPIARIGLVKTATGFENADSTATYSWKSDTGNNFKTTNYPNNYPINMNISKTFTKVGATQVRLRFTAFNMEANYDYGIYKYANGTTKRSYSGNLGPLYTDIVYDDTCQLQFTSDGSVARTGAYAYLEYYSADTVGSGYYYDARNG